MNGTIHGSSLPDLKDDDVLKLYEICQRATRSNDPPYRSLFRSYADVLRENGVKEKHESILYRWVMAIGDGARTRIRSHSEVDLVSELNTLLRPRGLQIHDDEHPELEEGDNATISDINAQLDGTPEQHRLNRRVSFGDAHVEETWLSERSLPFHASPPTPAITGLLAQPPRRGRDFIISLQERRARSASSRHDSVMQRLPSTGGMLNGSIGQDGPELEATVDHLLLYEPSQTQLDQNADAFLATTNLRLVRRYLHNWHDLLIEQHSRSTQAYVIATAHDQHELLKTSMNVLRAALRDRLEIKRIAAHWELLEDRAEAKRNFFLLYKAFTHWVRMGLDARRETEVASRHVLRVKYFLRWRSIATQNALKAKSILYRKFFSAWQTNMQRQHVLQQQATVYYEQSALRKTLHHLSRMRVESRIIPWRESRIKHRVFVSMSEQTCRLQDLIVEAAAHYRSKCLRKAYTSILRANSFRRRMQDTAIEHHDSRLKRLAFQQISISIKLAPSSRSLVLKFNLDLQRKHFRWLHQMTLLERQASTKYKIRLLQRCWTGWNDRLRVKALVQTTSDRVLSETLCKWSLYTKLAYFKRWTAGRLVRRLLRTWNTKTGDLESRMTIAQATFDQHQTRRLMSSAMVRLNNNLRQSEDGERAALEFANAHRLPEVLGVWKARTAKARELSKWAADARWYCLTRMAIKTWEEKTKQHQHQRRRDAYAIVRARVKRRIASSALLRWKTNAEEIARTSAEAEQRVNAALTHTAIRSFNAWSSKTAAYKVQSDEASSVDVQKLLTSAFKALVEASAHVSALDRQAQEFRHETELALMSTALKRLQWLSFTNARQEESADALRTRNRDQHVRQMLRHWAIRATTRKVVSNDEEDREPESPSIRPASRARARSASLERNTPALPPSSKATAPAYMRSPSRSSRARASRFRPLPTPASFTPMSFTSAYLLTTPDPLETTALPSTRTVKSAYQVGTDVALQSEGMAPQITPFSRKLRAGGFTPAGPPPSALKRIFGRSIGGASSKSVRFAGGGRSGSGPGISTQEAEEEPIGSN
ncbi:hypothetical protein K431DRAFT_224140 [Polychaeton citri CBS 116435]|uniref:Sfi1 spindle body domain-containing protein n=1 Tax=Polychaeton citri CBS 116435 TaxID=1314669 RepID=A0A9P4UQG3_9PEZI|nr:hypothetical protein K431DRAFT_224140 [Polychaeton citri CBS 116435]